MKIKTFLFLILIFQIIRNTYSQDYYSMLFPYDFAAYNPAYAGMYNDINLKFSTLEYNNVKWSNNSTIGNFVLYMPIKKASSSIGFHSSFTKFSSNSTLDIGSMYSFKYAFNKNFLLAIGSDISLKRTKIQESLIIIDQLEGEDNFIQIDEDLYQLNFDFGIWAKLNDFQLGITGKNLKPSLYISNNDSIKYKIESSANFILTHNLRIGDDHNFENSIIIKYYSISQSFYFMINNNYTIKNKYIVGLTNNIGHAGVSSWAT